MHYRCGLCDCLIKTSEREHGRVTGAVMLSQETCADCRPPQPSCDIINKQMRMCSVSRPHHPSFPVCTHMQALKYTQTHICSDAHTGTNTHTHTVYTCLCGGLGCVAFCVSQGEIRMGLGFHRTRRRRPHDS